MSDQTTYRVVEVKLYPTAEQIKTLSRWLRVCCRVYNLALEHRKKSYKRRGETSSLYGQQKLLTVWRARIETLRGVPVQFERDALRRLDRAYKDFFRRVKAKVSKKGFPRFKSEQRWRSMECLALCAYGHGKKIHVPGLSDVRYRGRRLEGVQKSLKIVRRASGWYAQLLTAGPVSLLPVNPQSCVGVDLGLSSFAALSNGEKVDNPRLFRKSERKLRIAQRQASRKRKGSRNRSKSYRRVASIYERTQAQRKDFAHQLSRALVGRFDLIAIEDLNVRGLAGGMLAKSVNDAAWGIFTFFLLYKAVIAGKQVVKVDPRGTSQECPDCGEVRAKTLSERVHSCPCGLVLDRDVAAARVILARALAVAGRTPVEGTASVA